MTYRQLLVAIDHARSIIDRREEILEDYPEDDAGQRAVATDDLAEVKRLDAMLDEEIEP